MTGGRAGQQEDRGCVWGPAGSGGLGDGHCAGCLVLTLLWLREASFLAVSGVHHFVEESTQGHVFLKAQGQPLLGAGVISGHQINVWASASSVTSTRLATACRHTSVPLLLHKSPGLGGRRLVPALLAPLLPSAEWEPRVRGGGPTAGSPVVGTSVVTAMDQREARQEVSPAGPCLLWGLGPQGFVSWPPTALSLMWGLPPPFRPPPPTLSSLLPGPCVPLHHPQSAAPLAPPQG